MRHGRSSRRRAKPSDVISPSSFSGNSLVTEIQIAARSRSPGLRRNRVNRLSHGPLSPVSCNPRQARNFAQRSRADSCRHIATASAAAIPAPRVARIPAPAHLRQRASSVRVRTSSDDARIQRQLWGAGRFSKSRRPKIHVTGSQLAHSRFPEDRRRAGRQEVVKGLRVIPRLLRGLF